MKQKNFLKTFLFGLFLCLGIGSIFGQSPGDLLITEFMPDPDNVPDSTGEYFEIYNTTGSPIDINGWTISDDGSDSQTIASSVVIPANGFAILAISSDPAGDGSVTPNYVYSSYTLSNGADEIVLTTPTSTEIARVNYNDGDEFGDGIAIELENINIPVNGAYTISGSGTNAVAATDSLGAGSDKGSPGSAGNTLGISAGNTGPQITSITNSPISVTSSDAVTISADITDADGFSADINWGTTSGNLTNTVAMSNTSGDTYEGTIPAQANGITVFYEIEATDSNASPETTTSAEQSYTVTDPTPGITLGAVSGNTNESATTATFTVVLDAQPTTDVVVNVSSGDTGEVSINAPTTLRFTNANWDTAKTVTVTGVDDADVDGNIDVTITVAVDDAQSDNLYDGLSETTTVTNEDNEEPSTIYTLDFETAGSYTTSITESIDESGDYFGRIENGVSTPSPTYTNFQGNFYFGAQDIDGIDSSPSLPVTLTISNIDISNFENLQLRVYLAEEDDGSNEDWDPGSLVHFSTDLGGGYTDILNIESTNSSGLNSAPAIDTNFDGTGNGTEITDTFSQFTASISGTGSTMDIQIEFDLDQGDIDIAIDNIEIIGTPVAATTVTWVGNTSDWSTNLNWDTNIPPSSGDNVVIPDTSNAPVISLATNVEVNDLTINELDGITISSGGTLIVNGTSTGNVNHQITLTNDDDDVTAAWHLVSSPVKNEIFDTTFADKNDVASGSGSNRGIASYNPGSTGSAAWSYFTGTDVNASSGQGFSMKITPDAVTAGEFADNIVTFEGGINTENVETASLSVGFNLLGNPYTSYVNSGTFLGAATSSNLDQSQIWLWNQDSGMYEVKTAGDAWVLAPGQGFFVKATSAGTVTFDESNQAATGNAFQKSEKTEVKLLLSDGENNRFAKLSFGDNFNKGYDYGWEGETFGGIPNSLSIFTSLVEDNVGKKYQVQSLPNSDHENMVIPIGLIADAGKEITFTAEALNLPSGLKVFLEDKLTNTFTRLDETNSAYTIALTEKLDGVGRFYLHTKASALNIDEVQMENISMYTFNASTLRIVGLPQGKASIQLFNILGKQVLQTSFTSNGAKDITLPNVSAGIYIVQLKTATGQLNQKITLD